MAYYAHSKESEPLENWQRLEDHLENVSALARKFASFFHAENWGELAGKNHDIGKGTKEWQAWLRRVNNVTDDSFSEFYSGHKKHAIHGAKHLYDYSRKEAGKLLAYCIAGHHGGLPDWIGHGNSGLNAKLTSSLSEVDYPLPEPRFDRKLPFSTIEPDRLGYHLQFFIRMIFSCLVDADYLDTEAFLDKNRSGQRSVYPSLEELYLKFWDSFTPVLDKAPENEVNRQREIVLNDCLEASENNPGLFSLTVPTGGGKTLSSLAFALSHAKKFNKRRIIYVIPFTSIIEQNATVFREMLGDDAVLEHHCNFIPEDSDWKTRLATENWDAPVIVTTNVRFFDSFYACKSSKCRKLHNVADSVVIFDEVQAIPVEKLKPCLEVLKELTQNYGVTAVLCTATQPAIEYTGQLKTEEKKDTEIIKDVPKLFDSLKRTQEEFIGEVNQSDISERLMEYDQVLCIVNTRQQALDVFNLLSGDGANFHLSALMHPIHRSRKLAEIRKRLKQNRPCRVVSTQLIEAGVDVDFPVVFRALAGMDAVAQAAGRCNREGRKDKGQVFVFKFADESLPSFFRQTAQCARPLFDKYAGRILEPDCIREYFLNYFWVNEDRMDADGIVSKCFNGGRGDIQFRELAEFRMIESAAQPIVVALEQEAKALIQQLEFADHPSGVLRKLQQYTVQVYPHHIREISEWLETPQPGIFVLQSPELYSEQTGLSCTSPEGEAFFV
ncbi:MAG: CRISPR-associated helicase Cas3' [Desulfobacteraceae bacterium]